MKHIYLLILLIIQSGTGFALTKNDVLSVQNGIYYLDGAPFAEIGWNKFDLNWLLWEELYKGRTLTDNNSMVIKQRSSIRELAESGVKTIRFFGNVHPTKFHTEWWPAYTDPSKRLSMCNAAMDKAIAICEEYNIRAIISLMCDNFVNKGVVPSEHLSDLAGNPNSQSRKDMNAYLEYVIHRYKNRKGVLAWEVTNEMTLDCDILPGTRVTADGEKKPTAAQLNQFYKDVCAKIKSIDTLRMVTSGGSILRETAYGLSQLTETQTSWPQKRDTYTQHKGMYAMYYQNTGFENIDIHFYLKKAPNYQILNDDGSALQLNEYLYNNLSESIGKPLMIGEYGALPKSDKTDKMYWLSGDDWFTTFEGESDTAKMYVQEACDRAVNSGCRLIYWWCYDSHRPQDQNDPQRMDLDITRTPVLFQKVLDANKRLKQKHNIFLTVNNSDYEKKCWFADGKLFIPDEYIGKTLRIFNAQGVMLRNVIAEKNPDIYEKGLLFISIGTTKMKILN